MFNEPEMIIGVVKFMIGRSIVTLELTTHFPLMHSAPGNGRDEEQKITTPGDVIGLEGRGAVEEEGEGEEVEVDTGVDDVIGNVVGDEVVGFCVGGKVGG